MPAQPYRKKVETIDALQYDGTNKQEMLSFAPGFVYDNNGTLMITRNPYPLLASEWVFKNVDNVYTRLDDATFQRWWTPGGGP
jgi:hypothetical protein